jgi:hypothetical protein
VPLKRDSKRAFYDATWLPGRGRQALHRGAALRPGQGALQALDSLVARLDSPCVFAGPKRGPFDVHNFRRREWNPAVDSSGIEKPARLCDLRSTFASNALAAGITVYELARIMGTSVAMIEAHYGALLEPHTAACLTGSTQHWRPVEADESRNLGLRRRVPRVRVLRLRERFIQLEL